MYKRRRGLSARSARRVHKKEYSEKALLELLSEHGELPQSYAEKRIVMIPVDPHTVHVYWQISPEEIADALRRFNGDALKYRPVLRFYQLNPERGGSRFLMLIFTLGQITGMCICSILICCVACSSVSGMIAEGSLF